MKRNCLTIVLLAWLLWVKQSPVGTDVDKLLPQMKFNSQPSGAYETQSECEAGITSRLQNWARENRPSAVSYPSVIVYQNNKKNNDPLAFYIINFYCYPSDFDPRSPTVKREKY
jgi:hypothetical protein